MTVDRTLRAMDRDQPEITSFTAEVSKSICIARVMCITLMMFVHVWPGASTILAADVPDAMQLFYVVVIREFGQASVPLLSIVSGYLFIRSNRSSEWTDVIFNKARTLLLPMAIWSALLLMMYMVKEWTTGNEEFFNVSPIDWINRVLSITAPPINLPLAFLRDIFVCCLIGMVANLLGRSRALWSALLLIFAIVNEYLSEGILLLRPQILVFFSLGYFVAISPLLSLKLPWIAVTIAVMIDATTQYALKADTNAIRGVVELIHRLAIAMLMWRISWEIAQRGGWLYLRLERLEKIVFLVFCSHMITVSLMAAAFNALGLQVSDPIYPWVFLLQIPIIYLSAILIRDIGEAVFPRLLALASARTPEIRAR
jgi:hypothetical protein